MGSDVERPRDVILDTALNAAEREYHSARARGDLDPVVIVSRPGAAGPDSFDLRVRSRAELIGALSSTFPALAGALAEGAGSPCLLTIVVWTPRGISTVDRYLGPTSTA